MLRTAFIASITFSIVTIVVSSWNCGLTNGQEATVIEYPSCGNCCQFSSVINGIYGCSIRNVWSSTSSKTECVVCFDDAFSLYKETLASSMYQSQKSSQIKLYKALPASPNSY